MTFFPSDEDAAFFEQERQSLQNRSIARAQIQQAADVKRMADEIAQLRSLLESTRKELDDYKAQQRKERNVAIVQAKNDQMKLFRHEYLVAGFSFLLAFVAERLLDLVQPPNVFLRFVQSLFH